MPAAIDDYAAIARRLRSLARREPANAGAADSIDPATSPGLVRDRLPSAAPEEGIDPEARYYFWFAPQPSPRTTAA